MTPGDYLGYRQLSDREARAFAGELQTYVDELADRYAIDSPLVGWSRHETGQVTFEFTTSEWMGVQRGDVLTGIL